MLVFLLLLFCLAIRSAEVVGVSDFAWESRDVFWFVESGIL